MLVYRGPSMLDPSREIQVWLTGFPPHETHNPKARNLIQTWVLPTGDVPPHELVKRGEDTHFCSRWCPLRQSISSKPETCYVKWFQAPRSVWESIRRKRPTVDLAAACRAIIAAITF